ncbi:MAG: hypothetical protein HY836_16600 [Aquabacterium sp.]|uniref:hypothetical protein n=1 Tax=Aquabacterium sp. TaxID=1872578 RepID=UPI0025C299A9|nr:hypothetical protein [Aquabacterium sp.]MBI5927212.1 hypothetical protein [Aquabacterium sp.]
MRNAALLTICLTTAAFAQAGTQAEKATPSQRTRAAQETAHKAQACVAAQPFYWEIGNGQRQLAGGSIGQQAPDGNTAMALASASKWLYGAYVAQQREGRLSDEDIRFLSFRSGYTRFRICTRGQTVGECQSSLLNGRGRPDSATAHVFDYNGGHMQKHAVMMGLGDMDNAQLAGAIKRSMRSLGPDWHIGYNQPQLAGGAHGTAANYARFLRGILQGDLQMSKLLGSNAVCANPQTCPNEAIKTPIPQTETWHYSIGHWVEDDPKVGDGAFSSPGAFGFYPWIDASKTFYGVLAREDRSGIRTDDPDQKPAVQSVDCGRLIRAAWLTGQAQH